MKICKNCGRQTEDSKIRCPYCGYLFEEDMDDVLREMKQNLATYKEEIKNASASSSGSNSGMNVVEGQPSMPVPGSERERFELLAEVAQLKGEMRVLHGEIDRLNSARGLESSQGQTYAQPVIPVSYAQPGVYSHYPNSVQPMQGVIAQTAGTNRNMKSGTPSKPRSKNRIVISVLCLLMLGLSIGMFFLPWIKDSFKGIEGVLYIFGKDKAGVADFAAALAAIEVYDFKGPATIAKICRIVCSNVVEYGILVYAGLLVFGLFTLLSLGGRIQLRAFHRFFAWMAFLVSLLLFGIFCWVFGFKAITMYFLLSAGANFMRCLFLIFYKKDNKFLSAGLR